MTSYCCWRLAHEARAAEFSGAAQREREVLRVGAAAGGGGGGQSAEASVPAAAMSSLEQIRGPTIVRVTAAELAVNLVQPDFVGPVAALAAGVSSAERAAGGFGVGTADACDGVGDDRCEVIAPSARHNRECTP